MSYSSEVLADSPAIYLRLDNTSGTTATDASGNGRHGTYIGQYVLAQTGLVNSDPSSTSVLVSDSSGTSGKVTVPVVTIAMVWTIEMIIHPVAGTGVPGNQCLFLARSGSDLNNAIWLVYDSGSELILLFGRDSSGADIASNAYALNISAGATYHVAGVLDGSAFSLYINGVQVYSGTPATGTVNITTSADGAYAIGAPFPGTYMLQYGGYIDEVAIYSGSYLSSARVAAHYAAMQASPPPPSVQGFLPSVTCGTQRAAHFPVHQLRL